MVNKIIIFIIFFFSVPCFSQTMLSCPKAMPTDHPEFCASFKVAAQCHCVMSGLPSGMCSNMKLLYDRLIAIFGSLQKICEYQHDTSTQDCLNAWNCYLLGGKDSTTKLCSSTGNACE